MPADIRSFFTPKGGPSARGGSSAASTPASATRKASARKRRVIEDSDDEEEQPPKKVGAKKPTPKKASPDEKKAEPTTTSTYFSSNGKSKILRSAPVKPAPKPKPKPIEQEEENFIDDDEDLDDGIFAEQFKKAEDDYREESPHGGEDTDREGKGAKPVKGIRNKRKSPQPEDEEEEEEEEEDAEPVKPATKARKPAAKRAKATPKKPRQEPVESASVKKILDSVPTIRAPTPPPRDGEGKKFNFRDFKQRQGPAAQGSKELPEGEENCLTGLTFVFTGVLESLSREDGQQLVKKYGGKITGAPSKKTSYVVLGEDAGPKKLETIRSHGIKTINEDGLFHLIRTLPANGGDGVAAKANEAKKAAEEKKVREMAKQMEQETKSKGKEAAAKEADQLWTAKYAPSQLTQICGNKGQVEKLARWLQNWPKNLKTGFKMRGQDGSGVFRAIMIHGPPGIGKTTAAHLVARLEGYDIVESNASDTRSKKLMEESLRGVLDNRSLMGYFASGKHTVDSSKRKLVLIMDEVDGMSAGDRGGVGQLASVCRKTNIPIICICNERKLPKMRPFDNVTFDLPFRRPDAASVRSRVMSIAFREGIKLPPNVIDQLVEGTHSDIRQIINMLSTYSTTQSTMNYDQSKQLAKAWEKHVVLKPWDIVQKLLGSEMFAASSKKTLNDKIELYFNDHEFSHLMVQENYLKTNPARANACSGKLRDLKLLELADNAAESISDGDLVDALIHGSQQHWSLMPTHGVFSTVKPASFMYGGYSGQFGFTSWLGNNSKYGKLSRYVKEIQSHIRLRASGDRHEVRQNYIPAFHSQLVRRLEHEGKDALPEIIETMDNYFLTKDDWDAICELMVGPVSVVEIPTVTKTAFTRQYNQMSHPMPFMKSSSIAAPKASKKDVPDIEDAIIESEDEGDEEAATKQEDEDELDLSKDKYIKAPRKTAARANGKGKAKAKDGDENKPKTKPKPRAKATASGSGALAARGKAKGKK